VWCSLLLVLIRFFTLWALWICCRQSSFDLWYALGGAPRWYHAGSSSLRCLGSFRGANDRLKVLAVMRRSRTHHGRVLAVLPWVGGRHDVRQKFGFSGVKS